MAPYVNNMKLIYRDLCRMNTSWDEGASEKIKDRTVEALSYLFKMEGLGRTSKQRRSFLKTMTPSPMRILQTLGNWIKLLKDKSNS